MRKRHILISLLIVVLILIFGWIPYRQKTADPSGLPTGKVYTDRITGSVNQVVEIPIFIDSQATTINAAELYLRFDPAKLHIESINTDGSFFTLWITDHPKFSNTDGTIALAGGLPNPGHTGTGLVATVQAKIIKRGDVFLTFDETSRVLLNDGKGTKQPFTMPRIRATGR